MHLVVRLAPLREVQRVHVPGEQRLEEQRLLAHPQRAQRRRRLRVKARGGGVGVGALLAREAKVHTSRVAKRTHLLRLKLWWEEKGRGGGTSPAASPTTKRQSSAAPKRRSSGAWRSLCASSESRTICATCKRVASGCFFATGSAAGGRVGLYPVGYCCYAAAAANCTCSGGSRGSLALSSSGPACACSSPSPRTSSPRCSSPAYSPCCASSSSSCCCAWSIRAPHGKGVRRV